MTKWLSLYIQHSYMLLRHKRPATPPQLLQKRPTLRNFATVKQKLKINSLGRKKYFSRQAVKILSAGSKNSLGRKKSPNSKVVHIVKFSLSNGHFQIDFDILTAALFFSINLHFCFWLKVSFLSNKICNFTPEILKVIISSTQES